MIPWRRTTETSCDVPSRRRWVLHLRRTCNVDETDRKTSSQRPLAGWYERFLKKLLDYEIFSSMIPWATPFF